MMDTHQLISYHLLVIYFIIFNFAHFCTNAKTHLIYWNPQNIIFRVKPAAVLHVEQRDEVIFVCPKDEYFILWTYNKQAFENCSLHIDQQFAVNILFRCSYESQRHLGSSTYSTDAWIPPFEPSKQIDGHSSMNLTTNMQNSQSQLIHTFDRRGLRRQKRKKEANKEEAVINRSKRFATTATSGEMFTLLINRYAWSSGTPSFQKDRPVFFTAQPRICSEENMRLTIVQGEFSWQKEGLMLKRENPSPKSTSGRPAESKDPIKRSFQECNSKHVGNDCRRSKDIQTTSSSYSSVLYHSTHINLPLLAYIICIFLRF